MTYDQIIALKRKVLRMGHWAGVRFLKNQDIPFELAHFIILGCKPRAIVPRLHLVNP